MKGVWLLLLAAGLASGLAAGPATSSASHEPHPGRSRHWPSNSGRGLPHSTTLSRATEPPDGRQLLECASPLALSALPELHPGGRRDESAQTHRSEVEPPTRLTVQDPKARPVSESDIPRALRHEAYVWQRDWTELVEATVLARAPQFDRLVPLAAEVTWQQGQPTVVRPALPFPTLAKAGRPVGLALRIGPFAGPFATNDTRARTLAGLAASLLAEARSNALPVAELQLDFDCAETRLDGYRRWVETIRRHVAPMPVVFTALPAWLKRAEFPALARSADGFVLQVHSLERPRGPEVPFTLCDPAAARRAVTKAGECGVPFRVALPTYGYLVAFDAQGKFIGLSAEGPSRTWPADVQLREVRAHPVELAELVAGWTTSRPSSMQGILWYRLPVPGDRLNWTWPTLAAVMAGREPGAALRVGVHRPQHGLREIEVRNDGARDESGRFQVIARWTGARLVACDGLTGFTVTHRGPQEIAFQSAPGRWPPDAARPIGWLRIEPDAEVEVQLEAMP